MTQQSRKQDYTFQYKMVSLQHAFFCGYGPQMAISVSNDIIELKNLAVHLTLIFDASVPAASRKLHYVGGMYYRPLYGEPDQNARPDNGNMMHVDLTADANRRIDVTLDLSHLIPLIPIEEADGFEFNQSNFMLSIITDPAGLGSVTGEMRLWKTDLIYTSLGIQ